MYEDLTLVHLKLPYIPEFLAFREVGFLVEAVSKLKEVKPHLLPQVNKIFETVIHLLKAIQTISLIKMKSELIMVFDINIKLIWLEREWVLLSWVHVISIYCHCCSCCYFLDHFSWREWNVAPQRYVYQFIIKMKFIAIRIFTKFNHLLGFLELNKVNW